MATLSLMLSAQDPASAIRERIKDLNQAKAFEELVVFIESLPEIPRAKYWWAYVQALHEAGHHDRVVAFAEKAPGRKLDQFEYIQKYLDRIHSLSLFELGRQDEAITLAVTLETKARQLGTMPLPLDTFAIKATRRQDWPLLEHLARTRLQLQPTHAGAKMWLGEALYLQNRCQEAEPVLNDALTALPQHALGWANLSGCLQTLKRNEEGIRAADKAVLLDPKCFTARFNRARCLLALEQYEPALAELKTAQSMAQDSPLLPSITSKIRETEAFLKAPKGAPKGVKAASGAGKATSRKKP